MFLYNNTIDLYEFNWRYQKNVVILRREINLTHKYNENKL